MADYLTLADLREAVQKAISDNKATKTTLVDYMINMVYLNEIMVVDQMFPLFWMVSTALKTLPQTRAYPPIFIPEPVMWRNFPDALTFLPFGVFFRNTFVIAVGVVVGELLSSSFVA